MFLFAVIHSDKPKKKLEESWDRIKLYRTEIGFT